MADKKERRFHERVKIEGAQVSYRCTKEKSLFGRFSHPMPLEDMTWSSVRFVTEEYLKSGEAVDLEMKIPGENKIKVKGQLIWSEQKPDDETNYAVVQLMPFGSGKQYNPLNIRNKLKYLITKYRSSGD
jgi:hypothetical protein